MSHSPAPLVARSCCRCARRTRSPGGDHQQCIAPAPRRRRAPRCALIFLTNPPHAVLTPSDATKYEQRFFRSTGSTDIRHAKVAARFLCQEHGPGLCAESQHGRPDRPPCLSRCARASGSVRIVLIDTEAPGNTGLFVLSHPRPDPTWIPRCVLDDQQSGHLQAAKTPGRLVVPQHPHTDAFPNGRSISARDTCRKLSGFPCASDAASSVVTTRTGRRQRRRSGRRRSKRAKREKRSHSPKFIRVAFRPDVMSPLPLQALWRRPGNPSPMTPLVLVVAVAITAVVSPRSSSARLPGASSRKPEAGWQPIASIEQDNKWLRDEVERHKQSLGFNRELLDQTRRPAARDVSVACRRGTQGQPRLVL